MMETITRAEAKARGLKRYFTGKACKRGHVAERYIGKDPCWGHCVECINEDVKARIARNPERRREISAASGRRVYAANPEKFRNAANAVRAANRDHYREIDERSRAKKKECGARTR